VDEVSTIRLARTRALKGFSKTAGIVTPLRRRTEKRHIKTHRNVILIFNSEGERGMIRKILNVNGAERMAIAHSDTSLADVLRENLFLTGTKVGCGKGECGACSVIMNGKVIRSCITRIKNVPDHAAITTIEGVGTPQHLHALQLAWIAHNGAQCGFCSPGFIVSAKALLDENRKPTREEVRDWFHAHHNACRCTGYKPLVDAVMDAARVVRGELKAEELVFKIPEDGRIWGTRHPRPTAVARVTGTLDHGADLGLKLPRDTLHLALAQAGVSHAEILSIDTAEAERMPGVFTVLTHKDVKGRNRIAGPVTNPRNKSDGLDRPILCDKKVFQYGDAMAIVGPEVSRKNISPQIDADEMRMATHG
jgi:aldehyde oxidoreductase